MYARKVNKICNVKSLYKQKCQMEKAKVNYFYAHNHHLYHTPLKVYVLSR